MKIYINEEQGDMLMVDGNECALCSIAVCVAKGYLGDGNLNDAGWPETLQDNPANDEDPTYEEQIASGSLREVTLEELTALGY